VQDSRPMWGARTLLAALAALAVLSGCGGQNKPKALPPVEAVVWAVGDGADGRPPAGRVARMVIRDRPAGFLYLGDVYETGTATEFRRNYHRVYQRLNPITAPTPGNHEWGNASTGYFPYWGAVKGRSLGPWYRSRIGSWEVLSLNSEAPHGKGSAQLRWLRANLEKPGSCRIALLHRPYLSAGDHGDARSLRTLWRTLQGHVTMVLSGHDHNMQRAYPEGGITQYVSGAGGRKRYGVHPDGRFAFTNDTFYGGLRIELRRGLARTEFRALRGGVLDRNTVRCRPLG
jgi:Calcineurin-like phosphoesterase